MRVGAAPGAGGRLAISTDPGWKVLVTVAPLGAVCATRRPSPS
jgi:hypothetical protein